MESTKFNDVMMSMVNDYMEATDDRFCGEDEFARYLESMRQLYSGKNLSAEVSERFKAYSMGQERAYLKQRSRVIKCQECDANYYYTSAHGHDGKCRYCGGGDVVLEDVKMAEIPPMIDPETFVWYSWDEQGPRY